MSVSQKERRWRKKQKQTKKQRHLKKLRKFFFVKTYTNNSNLISTFNLKKRFFYFKLQFLSLSSFSLFSLFSLSVVVDFVLVLFVNNFLFVISLFVVVLGCFMLIVNGCVVWYAGLFLFLFSLLTTFFLLKNGRTALHIAAEKGFEQIVKILIKHGSNVHLQDRVLIFLFLFLLFFLISLFVCCCGFIVQLFHV